MRYLFWMILIMPLLTNAQSYENDSVKLTSAAFKTLQQQMKKKDFKILDWMHVQIDTLPTAQYDQFNINPNEILPILKIPSIHDSCRFLLYTKQNQKEYFNWVKLSLVSDSGFCTGSIQTFSIKGKLLQEWKIKKDKTLQSSNDSFISDKAKKYERSPKVILRLYVNNSDTSLTLLSAYYVLFNKNLEDDNPLSSVYIFLNYNALLYDHLFGHWDKKTSEQKL